MTGGPASRSAARRHQGGLALIAFLALLTAGVLYFVVEGLDAATARRLSDQKTTDALNLAKDALLARAVLDNNRPGSLPCPAADEDGIAELLAGSNCPSYVGRLPWRTLRIGQVRDGAGELLWYALSRSLRDDDSAEPIHTLTPGDLSLNGAGDGAAIIFAPGAPAPGQTSRPSNAVGQYLESGNTDGDDAYVAMPQAVDVNDRALMVGRKELMRAVSRRVTRELGRTLSPYFVKHGTLPCAASATSAGTPQPALLSGVFPYNDPDLGLDTTTLAWLQNNQWFAVVQYTVNGCAPSAGTTATLKADTVTNVFTFP